MKRALAVLCALLISACEPKDGPNLSEAGMIQLVVATPITESLQAARVQASYGKNDPLKPEFKSIAVSSPIEASQNIPTGIRLRGATLALQSIEVIPAVGAPAFWAIKRPELDEVRLFAAGGPVPRIELEIPSDGEPKATARVTYPTTPYWELPFRTRALSLRSVEPELLDLLRLDDTQDSLLKLRWASSATEEYHEELLALARLAPALDVSRLELLLDAFYFPTAVIEDMRRLERRLQGSESPEDLARVELLRLNIARAEEFAALNNQLVTLGMLKIKALSFEQGESILRHLNPSAPQADAPFDELVRKLGGSAESIADALQDAQKTILLDLAVRKKALGFAARLAADLFAKGADKSAGALIDLTRRFPSSPERDQLTLAALQTEGPMSIAELAALVTPLQSRENTLRITEALLPRIKELTSHQVLLLVEQHAPDEVRDTLLLMALRQTTQFDAESIRSLLLLATNWTVRGQMCALVLPKLAPLKGKAFAFIIQILPAEAARDTLLFQGLALAGSLTPADFAAMANIVAADESFEEFLQKAIERLTPFRIAEATATADLMLERPVNQRDAFIIKAAEGVTDLQWSSLEQLLIRSSSEATRARVREIAHKRLGS